MEIYSGVNAVETWNFMLQIVFSQVLKKEQNSSHETNSHEPARKPQASRIPHDVQHVLAGATHAACIEFIAANEVYSAIH